jgi:hypothetical protein
MQQALRWAWNLTSLSEIVPTISLQHTCQVELTRDLDVITSLVNVDTIAIVEDSL